MHLLAPVISYEDRLCHNKATKIISSHSCEIHTNYIATVFLKGEEKMSAFTTQRWQFYLMSNSAKRFGLRGRRQLLDLSTNIK